MREMISEEFGRIQVRPLPLPQGVDPRCTVYTWSGRVACQYRLEGDPENYIRIMTLEDDGTDICQVYAGELELNKKANGFRYMPFMDNKRVYIGDYILECEPDCDHAQRAEFIPIHYPEELVTMPGLWMVWSENVVSQDNEHIAWSTLAAEGGGVYVARLRRTPDCYELDEVRCVSSPQMFREDPEHPGCMIPEPARGGEVKQFVRGGKGLSYVGMGRGPGNSMYQALDSEEVIEVTRAPGYDETTIFSPDERLGIVMSTRFSPKTNCAIVGLIPRRGNMMTKSGLAMNAYLYAIAGARVFRDANIGPALVDLKKSREDLNYLGVDLHDPEERFVYYSPMSWHPSSKKAMWNERLRRNLGEEGRVMIAELLDYEPGPMVEAEPVPQEIPYATKGVSYTPPQPSAEPIRIAGRHCGYVESRMERTEGAPKCITEYRGFSDDGKTFYEGTEYSICPGLTALGDTVYEADLSVTGEHTGRMELRLVFRREGLDDPVRLSEESQGYATYDGDTLYVKDMDFS